MQLRAQRLAGPRPRNPDNMLRELGAVQLDTISVLARSHELVAYARLGAVPRAKVEKAYWSRPARAFEYWGHQASILPIEWWPYFAFRRRRYAAAKTRWNRHASEDARAEVVARVTDLGPITTKELGGAKGGGPWWDWTPVKAAAELLLDEGVLACVERKGFRRVYDLASRAIPAELLDQEPDDVTCATELVRLAADRLGVATASDLGNYFMLRPHDVKAGVAGAGLEPVKVAGWPGTAYAAPGVLDAVEFAAARTRPTLLSPFDSLLWDRRRVARVHGVDYRVEIFVPAAKRVFGYYAMPLLAGGRLCGLVDPKRDGRTFIARRVRLDAPRHVDAMARALRDAANWVGCDNVVVDAVEPQELEGALDGAISGLS